MISVKTINRKGALLGLFALSAVAGAAALRPAEAATPSFDGMWSVVILTQQGLCEPSYRAPVRIIKGNMANAGSGNFTITGSVGKNGVVTVMVSQGANSATGTGRLTAKSGGGSWSGGPCSGTWQAEKRA